MECSPCQPGCQREASLPDSSPQTQKEQLAIRSPHKNTPILRQMRFLFCCLQYIFLFLYIIK